MKDKIPEHEKSICHKNNYIAWRNTIKFAQASKSINNYIIDNLEIEIEKWRKIFYRVLDIIIFLSERGLSFRGFSERIGEANDGSFLGMVELLAKYDSFLNDRISNVRNAQNNDKKCKCIIFQKQYKTS